MNSRFRHTVLPLRLLALAVFASTGWVPSALCQEAGKIADQYVKASGGSRALGRIQTLVGEKNLIEAYNGKSAWHQTAAGELGTLVGPEGMQLEAAAQYYNSRLLNL